MLPPVLTWSIFASGLAWLLLIVVARWGERTRPWPIELLDTFALYAFAPFVGLVILAALLRSRLLLALCLAAGLLFGQQIGHLFMPSPAVAATAGTSLRVLTYNVLWRNRDARPLADLVRTVQPDLIVLQELSEAYVEDLRRLLGSEYPFSALTELTSGNDASGIFSRLPIIEDEPFRLTGQGNTLQRIQFRLDGSDVHLYNLHLLVPRLRTENPPGPLPLLVRGFESPERDRELERLIAETGRLPGPFILAGDFNTAAGSRPYRRFPAGWRDSFAERGWGFGHTYPSVFPLWRQRLTISFPLVRIDYILSSSDLIPARAWVPWVHGSDHLPVIAELHLSTARQGPGT
jgi:vancomycin resistance protein VanJ